MGAARNPVVSLYARIIDFSVGTQHLEFSDQSQAFQDSHPGRMNSDMSVSVN